MSFELKFLLFILAATMAFFYRFWMYCAHPNVQRSFWALALEMVIWFGLLLFTLYIICCIFDIEIYTGYCDQCGEHYGYLLDRWADEITLLKCRRCGAIVWYI